MAGEYLPPVVVEITGNTDGLVAAVARAKAALDTLKNSGGDVKINFDANAAGMAKATLAADAMTAATNRARIGGARWTTWLAAAHNILTVFGANIIADTIGIIAFGIGAVAAFGPVVTAVGNLGATYGELNPLQKVATVQITNFMHAFQAANNAGIFAVFTQLMNMVGQATGKAGGIMDQATIAFENFAAMLRQAFSSAPWQAMFARSSGVIQQDLTALFKLITALINVIPALFHDFNGLGLAVLGGATAVLQLIAYLGNADPALVRFAAMVFLVYRALRFLSGTAMFSGMFAALGKSTGIAAIGFKDLGAAASLARTEGVVPAISALFGISSEAVIAGGAVGLLTGAIIYSNFALTKHGIGLQDQIGLMAQVDGATGNNLAGYQKLAGQLTALTRGTASLSSQDRQGIAATRGYAQASGQLTQAQQAAVSMAHTLSGNLTYLERTYHLTQAQAYQLARATGTDLTQAFSKGGGAAQATRMKIAAYEQTVKAAQNPTSALAYDMGLAANKTVALSDRVTALTNAFNALLTPFATVIQDTVTWKDGNGALEKAVDAANGKVGYGTVLQRAAASALATSITNTTNLTSAILQQTGSYPKAIAAAQQEINVLQALHSKSSLVQQAIAALRQTIDSLHSKSITLTAIYRTVGSPLSATSTLNPGYASGTGSATRGWHTVGEKGPELMYFRGGEKVIPHHAIANVTGYANGTGPSGGQVIENVIMLDGKVLYKAMKDVTAYKNFQNNVRTPHGSAQGRMGTR